jgi:hypothetical protein
MSNLLLGTIAGAINVCFVQPLWVANARLKLQGNLLFFAIFFASLVSLV